MWRKTFKKAAYASILVVPFLIIFFHPKNYRAAALLDAVVRPVGLLQVPAFELKKLFFYRETYDEYLRYKRQNELLKARLLAIEENAQQEVRYGKIQDFRNNQNYASTVANVIGRDPSNWNASLIIDKGKAEGIEVGQPVVSSLGVVGRIFEVGANSSKVVLVSDPAFAVAAVVLRSRENGLLTGTLQGVLRLQYLTDNADVKVGDSVVTSQMSTAFPEGILIGQITDVQASVNSHTVECLVDPAVDLSELEQVIVIKKVSVIASEAKQSFMNAIEIKNLVKTYRTGTKALKGVDLTVPDGDFFALLGANGAGKTTIIGILTGLVTKTAGTVEIFGHSIDNDFEAAKKCIGVVPQEFNFNMFEPVQDIVVNQAGYFGIDYKIAFKDSEEILKRVGLWEKRKSMARTLSGGMKRRLMIARGLIHHPRMLILDEPTAGVDVELRHGMWKYLTEINASGTTILLTTHYLEEVEEMCRNCAIIKDGEIVRRDSVHNLLMKLPQDTYRVTVKEMLSLENVRSFNPVKIDEHTLDIEIQKREELNELILKLAQSGFVITDFHPKGNRLEKLFLEILRK